MKTSFTMSRAGRFGGGLILLAAIAGCNRQPTETKPGQALASVNGAEITVLQLNEELQRAGVGPAQQEAASKQLLQALIDRQLLQGEAAREKLDRDPKVMQAIERAKALIIAQAYLQKRVGNPARPTDAEIADYFNKHPEFFTHRKQISMQELVFPSSALTPELKAAADAAKSLEEVALWLDARHVKYGRTQVARSTADLAPALAARLLGTPRGQLFIVKEGERALLIAIADVKEAPVALEAASPQIAQFLVNQKSKEIAAAELSRLRAAAKIDYINKSMAIDPKAPPAPAVAPAVAEGADAAPPAGADPNAKAALERGVAGLK